jgi:hypothetical protein
MSDDKQAPPDKDGDAEERRIKAEPKRDLGPVTPASPGGPKEEFIDPNQPSPHREDGTFIDPNQPSPH